MRSRQYDVFTHAGPGAAFRAPGQPQGVFALDQLVDELAERLGMDSLELRDRLDVDERDGAATSPERVARKLERRIGADKIGWKTPARAGRREGPDQDRHRRRARRSWRRIVDMDSACEVRLARDGSVQLRSSVMDIGTGTRTALAMILAEDFGLRPEDIHVQIGDTRWPIGPSSGGSKTLVGITPAVRQAAHEVRTKLFAAVGKKLGVEPKDAAHRARPRRVARRTRARRCRGSRRARRSRPTSSPRSRADPRTGRDRRRTATAACSSRRSQVDTETGVIRVLKVVAVQECGRLINPLAVQSQINGGIIHGISWALFEDRRLDRQDRPDAQRRTSTSTRCSARRTRRSST